MVSKDNVHEFMTSREVQSGRRGGWAWMGALALGLVACGDDGNVSPNEGSSSDTTNGSSTTTMGSEGSSGDTSTNPPTTGLDSTGTTSAETTGLDSSGTTAESSGTEGPNLPPDANDDVYFVRRDQAPLVVDVASGVLANDLEPEGEGISVDSADAMSAAGGTVLVEADGAFEYTPPADFFGDDSFVYVAIDDVGGTSQATVRITVGPEQLELGQIVGGLGGFAIDGAVMDDESGFTVAGGGDVDGDGLDDLVITSPDALAGQGRAWVVFGKADGATVDLADIEAGIGGFAITGESVADPAGNAAAIVGDVDGDTLADILVGAELAGTAGRAYLVHGKADGVEVDLADIAMGIGGFMLEGDGFGEDAGSAVAAAGDIDGDGLRDLLVGAPEGGPIPGGGRTYVIYGKSDTMVVALADVFDGVGGFAIRGAGFDDNLGWTVSGAGDVDADGLDDVLAGAQLANAGGFGNSGRCYVVFGKTNTDLVDVSMLGAGGFFIDGSANFDEACSAVAGLGDMNGDGRADLGIGAVGDEADLVFQGRVHVVHGKADGATVTISDIANGMGGFSIEGEAQGDFLGLAVGGPGDFDGDGFADLVLGTANVDLPGIFAGRGYMVFGKSDGAALPLTELSTRLGGFPLLAEAAQDQLGWATSGAGDINGDGFADLVISARRADPPGAANAGRSYVVFGGNFSGALTHLGGSSADTLEGGPGIDFIVAGAGDDEIHGGGGSDVLYAGAGDDFIGLVSGQFFRVDGGSGYDTLAFEDGGVQLDLAVVADVALLDIEAIDLTGTGDNLLELSLRDLRAMVGSSRVLRVLGEGSDTLDVDLSGAGFVDEGLAAGVHTWQNGVFTLEVVEPLVANVVL